jgi:type I restriction enzyme M protein
VRSQKATKNQNGKCYVLTPQRYVGAEAEEEEEEEEGLDEKMLHLTAKLERQFAESAKLEALTSTPN